MKTRSIHSIAAALAATSRSFAFVLLAAVVVLNHSVALAIRPTQSGSSGGGRQIATPVQRTAPPARRAAPVRSAAAPVRTGQPSRGTANLPQTSQLDRELAQTHQSLNSLAAKIYRTERSVESARKAAQNVQSMIKALGRLDSKIGRIKRELESLARIPQLRVVKPMVKALGNVHKEIHTLRVKADKADRNYLRPMISRLQNVERKLEAKLAEVREVAGQTQQARQQLARMRSFVAGRGNRPAEVAALEAAARPVRGTIRPMRQMISQLDRALGGVERDFNGLAQKLNAVSRAKGSLQKVDRDLAAADKVARDLNKVLSKKISIKFPVKVSVSVRQVLEAPGKLIDIVVKPLEALARKALDPVLRKLQFKIDLPRDLAAMPAQLDGLSSVLAGVQTPIAKIERALQVQTPQAYRTQIGRLLSMTPAQLAR